MLRKPKKGLDAYVKSEESKLHASQVKNEECSAH